MKQVDEEIVKLTDLSFSRGAHVICEKMNLTIPRGKITAIMGPSGAGKTTLLRLIGGQLQPQGGQVWVAGQDINALSRTDLFALRKRMGMLFQSGALFSDMNVYDNVALPLRTHTSLSPILIRHLVMMKLEAVGLRNAHQMMPAELSGGMARRAALARTIALDPDILLYDEPFAGQDPISMGVLVHLIKNLNDALGLTSILVSHDVAETASIADHIYIVAGGHIVGSGSPAALMRSTNEWVRQFMHGLPDGPVPFHYPGKAYTEDLLEDSL